MIRGDARTPLLLSVAHAQSAWVVWSVGGLTLDLGVLDSSPPGGVLRSKEAEPVVVLESAMFIVLTQISPFK